MFAIARTAAGTRRIIVERTSGQLHHEPASRARHARSDRRDADPDHDVRGIAVTTCAERLSLLAGCRDASSLRSAVQELCTEFGKVTRIDVLTMTEAERRRALCLLRLESPAQEQELMRSLGVPRFGEDVLIVVDLRGASARPTP
jgi:hypothetical protein